MFSRNYSANFKNSIRVKGDLPGPVAAAFYKDRSYFSAIQGPLGSGKTNTCIFKLLQVMAEQEPNQMGVRPTRLIIIRNTYPDLISTTMRDWAAMTNNISPVRMGHPPTQMLKWSLPDETNVECDILFIALDREEDVRKLRGVQSTFVWANEIKETHKATIDMAFRSLGRYPSMALGGVRCTKEHFVADYNAPDEDHWIVKLMNEQPDGWSFYVQPPGVVEPIPGIWKTNQEAENLINLPENYYEKLVQGKRRDWILVNLANEFGSSQTGKAIHPEFATHLHVKEFAEDEKLPVFFGMDFGLTPAVVLAQHSGDQLRIFDEIVTENFSSHELCEELQAKMAVEYPKLLMGHGFGDPAGSQRSQADKMTPFIIVASFGFNVAPAWTNSFEKRRDSVTERLLQLTRNGEPALIIHPRCKNLIKAMLGGYEFKRMRIVGQERYADIPDKNMFSHIAEALQYLCVGFGTIKQHRENKYSDWSVPINIPRVGLVPGRKGFPSSLLNLKDDRIVH